MLKAIGITAFLMAALFAASIDFEPPKQPATAETITVETIESEPIVISREAPEITLETWIVTAYCACDICCAGSSDGLTANMSTPLEGVTIAADKSIPFGTRIWIEGLGEWTVMDRGSAITGKHIDVFFKNHETAKEFGVKNLEVRIME